MSDMDLVAQILNEMESERDGGQQMARIAHELKVAYGRYKAIRVPTDGKSMTITCPRCKSLMGCAKGPGELIFCMECGQCIRLSTRRRKD